jgi:hypothetical protein
MSESFERFWFSRDCDGYTPDIVLSSIINLLIKNYSEKKFSFAYSPTELKKRIVKYFYLSFTIRYDRSKRIQGPLSYARVPSDWTDKEEYEWQQAYWYNFDSQFWEKIFGKEASWEDPVYRWRYELPSIFQTYTIRSRDQLIVLEDPYDVEDEWNYEPDN